MNCIRLILIVNILLQTVFALGQDQLRKNVIYCESLSKCGDCNTAIEIKAIGELEFECTPFGYGTKLEISKNISADSCYFDKEHNTIWLIFNTVFEGLLTFNIKPKDLLYDFDFMLFSGKNQNFCKSIITKEITPIRSNKSRNDTSMRSFTGLTVSAKQNFVNSGPGEIYSNALNVKKGDPLLLVIDNVYNGKQGFSLEFIYYEIVTFNGELRDKKTDKPIEAEITWEDVDTGEILATTISSGENGSYTFNVPINKQKPLSEYNLSCNSDSYFFTEQSFSGAKIKEISAKPIKLDMAIIENDYRIKLPNLNFEPNSAQYLKSAIPTLRRLKKLMNTNPTLKIQIEGHTNGCFEGVELSQKFSEDRANSVKTYLVENGINEYRISTIGYNCSKMLFPDVNNPYHGKMNRRVEVIVIEY